VLAGSGVAVLVIVFVGAGTVMITVAVGAGAFGASGAAALPHPASVRAASADPASSAFLEVLIGHTSSSASMVRPFALSDRGHSAFELETKDLTRNAASCSHWIAYRIQSE
jgi:hypothetical protein